MSTVNHAHGQMIPRKAVVCSGVKHLPRNVIKEWGDPAKKKVGE